MRKLIGLMVVLFATLGNADELLGFGRGVAVRGGAIGPAGGVRTGGAARGVSVGPFGGVNSGAVRGGSYQGPGGTSVQHVGGRGVSVGPFGGVSAGGAGATRVTGPTGNTWGTAQRGGVAVGPRGGVRMGGTTGTAVRTPYGATAVGRRGGVTMTPTGAWSASGVRVGAVGHTTGYISPTIQRQAGVTVRTSGYYPYFNRTWYAGRANAWVAPRWVVGYNPWTPPAWGTLATFVGIKTAPIVYDYGSTVVINDNSVYVNGQVDTTATEYATQAAAIANAGRAVQPPQTDEWQPLGVFGLIQPEDTVAQRIFQLAVNAQGVLRGNYYDAVADSTTPVYGSIDQQSQRVAWSIGDKKDIVFESGLNNLTKDESTVLIHYGNDSTQQMLLVRLEESKDNK